MIRKSLKKFAVSVEVANFISYLKYIDKQENHAVQALTDSIDDLIQKKSDVSKDDIKSLVNLHANLFIPNQFKEEKFNYYYNPITNERLDEEEIMLTHESPFIIELPGDMMNRFDSQVITNLFTDRYNGIYFLLNVRYYGIEKRVIPVEFELMLDNNVLVLTSEHSNYVSYFLKQYTLQDIIKSLGLDVNLDFKESNFTPTYPMESIEDAYLFDKATLLDFLMESYETSHFIFINSAFFKTLEIDVTELVIEREQPKLLIILEPNHNNYFNTNLNYRQDRIEQRGNNTLLFVSDHLIREACGNLNGIILMNEKHHLSLKKVNADYDFMYLTKVQTQVRLMRLVIETYFERDNQFSILKQLTLYAHVLNDIELSKQLNYHLPKSIRVSNSLIYNYKNRGNDRMTIEEIDALIDLKCLCLKLERPVVLSIDNTALLLAEIESMIHIPREITAIETFEKKVRLILEHYNDHQNIFFTQIEGIYKLLKIKHELLKDGESIKFILDTSALIEEPDLLHKFFRGKKTLVHSIVKEELESQRSHNFNAIRALRNINLCRNDAVVKLEVILDDFLPHDANGYKPRKVVKIEQVMEQCVKEGNRPILISNDESAFHLYEYKHKDIIQLRQLPLIIS